jgi:protein gp37
MAERFPHLHGIIDTMSPDGGSFDRDFAPFSKVQFHPSRLDQPLRWKKPRRIFVCSMGDLFHEDVKEEWLAQIFDVMCSATTECGKRHKHEPECWTGPPHTFMLLTKRPERMKWAMENIWQLAENFVHPDGPLGLTLEVGDWPPPQIWLGVTAENQEMADQRIPILLQTPAAKRFVSIEPCLSAMDLKRYLFGAMAKKVLLDAGGSLEGLPSHLIPPPSLDWVICGGESGPGARPMHPDWARDLRDQCQSAGVPFFFKGWGCWMPVRAAGLYRNPRRIDYTDGVAMLNVGKKAASCLLGGKEWKEFPK